MSDEYASIEHSKKLAHLFSEAEWWWVENKDGDITLWEDKPAKESYFIVRSYYPAITIQMAWNVLPDWTHIIKDAHLGGVVSCQTKEHLDERFSKEIFYDKSLPNALCKMIEYLEKEGLL